MDMELYISFAFSVRKEINGSGHGKFQLFQRNRKYFSKNSNAGVAVRYNAWQAFTLLEVLCAGPPSSPRLPVATVPELYRLWH